MKDPNKKKNKVDWETYSVTQAYYVICRDFI